MNPTRLAACLAILAAAVPTYAADPAAKPRTIDLAARDTLGFAEINKGDELRFKLKNGQTRSFVLEASSARIVEKVSGGIVYSFESRFKADGQPVTLRRYVCSQESFSEPWVVNGVRLWLSSGAAIFKSVPARYPEDHYPFDTDAVLVVQDATLPICPGPLRPWYPNADHFIDVGTCYNGDDPWLGPYLGQACHIGLDVNMRKGTPLTAPIDFDDQWIFSADHRWRGVRKWPNGDVWALQSHHVEKLLVKERTPLKAGTHYAEAAGKGVGTHQHSHFEFRLGPTVLNPGKIGGVEVDPWIVFWQMFEIDKAAKGHIRAAMEPLAPARVGEAVRFSAAGSRAGKEGGPLRHTWAFGDGGTADGPTPTHAFTRPGVHPVTLVIDDGRTKAAHTQHLTVTGEPRTTPALALDCPDETTFHRRPVEATDVYGWPVRFTPHTLRLAAAPGGQPKALEVALRNAGGGELAAAGEPAVEYRGTATGWLTAKRAGTGNAQRIVVAASAAALAAGTHEATVTVACAGAANGRQSFGVAFAVRPSPTAAEVVIDDRDPGFFATPYAWVGHQFLRCRQRGHGERYLTNGGVAAAGAVARFTPDLAAGEYEVSFHKLTPFVEGTIPIRVRHAGGEKTVAVKPTQDGARRLGVFTFEEGTGGFVELAAEGSAGLILADAVVFRRVKR